MGASTGKAPRPDEPADSGYPRSIDNCGRKVTLKSALKRAASLNQGTTEILLSSASPTVWQAPPPGPTR